MSLKFEIKHVIFSDYWFCFVPKPSSVKVFIIIQMMLIRMVGLHINLKVLEYYKLDYLFVHLTI